MAISVKTRVLLWGRAAARCAFSECGKELVYDASETDDESLIGDIAHIVAESVDGPRGTSNLTAEQRDKYTNLILLCKNHHKLVDDQPIEFSVQRLEEMKAAHEVAVRAWRSPADIRLQDAKQRAAGYVDEWASRASLEQWKAWTSWLMQAEPILQTSRHVALHELLEWTFRRIWPPEFPELSAAFRNFAAVLSDVLVVFEKYADHEENVLRTRKSYRHSYNDERDRLHKEFEDHVDLVTDLVLELTRAANYVCDAVRQFIDPLFQIDTGALIVETGMDIDLQTYIYRPEYRQEERTDQPYPGLEQFRDLRAARDIHYGPR